jgi:hypothetical protein
MAVSIGPNRFGGVEACEAASTKPQGQGFLRKPVARPLTAPTGAHENTDPAIEVRSAQPLLVSDHQSEHDDPH